MGGTGFVALGAGLAIFPSGLQGAAGGWALVINLTRCAFTNNAYQGSASWLFSVGSADHCYAMRVKFFGEFWWGIAADKGIRFRPMKGHPKKSATGAASQTGMCVLLSHRPRTA